MYHSRKLGIAAIVVLLSFCTTVVGIAQQVPTIRLQSMSDDSDLPEYVDNSILKYFPPIISQIGGSCAQASTIGYMFTYEMNRLLDRSADVPENRFSYLYAWNFINHGEDDGSISLDGLNLGLTNGIMTEADFPNETYTNQFLWGSGYDKYLRGIHYRVKNYVEMDITDDASVTLLKRYLYNGGESGRPGKIVVFSSGSLNWKIDNYYAGPSHTGYRSLLTALPTGGAHAMTIVGYDDSVELSAPDGTKASGAFIVVNSHGSFSHDNGHFYLPYWFFTHPKASGEILSPEVTGVGVEYHQPLLVFRVAFKYSSRNDLSFRVGVADKPYSTIAKDEYAVSIMYNQGGDYPMQGFGKSADMEVAFNATNLLKFAENYKDPKFFLAITRKNNGKSGDGYIKSFSVYDYRQGEDSPVIYVCNEINNNAIAMGDNVYGAATTETTKTSASSIDWLDTIKWTPRVAPFVVRTADGKYVKVNFIKYDKASGKIVMKYRYAPDGSTHLGN